MSKLNNSSCFAAVMIIVIIMFASFIGLAQTENKLLDKAQKDKIINKVSELLKDNYVFPDVAEKISEHLKEVNSKGIFETKTDLREFTKAVTKEIRFINNDRHLGLHLITSERAEMQNDDPIMAQFMRKLEISQSNYGFIKVEILDGNIGYIDLRGFLPVSMGKDAAVASMKFVQNSDALIFDLRKNNGGSPDMIRFLLSYLFDKKTHINDFYSRRTNAIEESWTSEKVEGKKMNNVPVFVLTSQRTFSAGEEFTYDIQTQKRGLIVGETTGGGANPGGAFRVNDEINIFIPTGRAINPVTKTNWEGIGVIPDVKISADKALDSAIVLAKKSAEEYREKSLTVYKERFKKINDNFNLAVKLYKEGKANEADKLISESLTTASKKEMVNEITINLMGYDFMAKQNYPVAISIFKFNTEMNPESANTYDSLGEAYMKNGNKQMAIVNYKKSLKLNPDNKNAVDMLKKLEQ